MAYVSPLLGLTFSACIMLWTLHYIKSQRLLYPEPSIARDTSLNTYNTL